MVHHHASTERMKQDVDLVAQQQIVGSDLVGRGVIGLRQNLPKHEMRRVKPAEAIDAPEQVGSDALHTRRISPWTLACNPQKFVTPAAVPMPPRKP